MYTQIYYVLDHSLTRYNHRNTPLLIWFQSSGYSSVPVYHQENIISSHTVVSLSMIEAQSSADYPRLAIAAP
jgi:hypothetical protein